jgi:nitrogen fixation protein NifU and related proteins
VNREEGNSLGALVDHGHRPRNNIPLSEFNGRARITGPCGDTMEFWVQVRDDAVDRVSFITDGCGISHACGSMATCLAQGRPLDEVSGLQPEAIIEALGGVPADHEHCALLSANTLKAACAGYSENVSSRSSNAPSVVRVAAAVVAGRLAPLVAGCDSLALLDVESSTMQVLRRQNEEAPPQEVESLPAWLAGYGVQVLICQEMEEQWKELFGAHGISVVVDAAPDIPEAWIASYLGGSFTSSE